MERLTTRAWEERKKVKEALGQPAVIITIIIVAIVIIINTSLW